MKKIYLSLVVVVAATAVVVGATTAFFSDTETSTGNVFTAGSIDLKVDSDCHYYNYIGGDSGPNQDGWVDVGCTENDLEGAAGYQNGNWSETDLGAHKFFKFSDLKPGDKGEDTISLHVYDNDAWGRVLMDLTQDWDNSCTEPEEEATGDNCTVISPENTLNGAGELLEAMLPGFSMWLDQGEVPGFQNENSVEWGNNLDFVDEE